MQQSSTTKDTPIMLAFAAAIDTSWALTLSGSTTACTESASLVCCIAFTSDRLSSSIVPKLFAVAAGAGPNDWPERWRGSVRAISNRWPDTCVLFK